MYSRVAVIRRNPPYFVVAKFTVTPGSFGAAALMDLRMRVDEKVPLEHRAEIE